MGGPDGENRPPVPLKHHTETALMLVLGVLIAATGFVLALLPAFPAGLVYWCILFALTALYPLLLASFFRSNRADYEFRLLHWVPAGMAVLWLVFELLSFRFDAALTAQRGFFAFWSLPLVALGIGLTIMFSAHVIRRRTVRIGFLAILLLLFTFGAYAAHMNKWNPALQAALFPQGGVTRVAADGYRAVAGLFSQLRFPGMDAGTAGSSSSASVSTSSSASAIAAATSSRSSSATASDATGTIASSVSSSKPRRLTKTGPEETLGLLIVTLLAGYCMTLHARAKGRMGVEWAA
jgi:hypothetical protein